MSAINMLAVLIALYRASLRLLPFDLRHEFGDDMVRLFINQIHTAHDSRSRVRLTTAALADVWRQAAAERWSGRHPVRFSMRNHMRNFIHDFTHGLRLLRRYPATAVVAIATLALGIGANTAIFSVVDAVLLRSLPFQQPDQLVQIFESRPSEGVMDNTVAPADYIDWRTTSQSFSAMTVYITSYVSLMGTTEPEQMLAGSVSRGFFDVIGMQPAMGRAFSAADEVPGPGSRVAILTDGLWRRQFGADPAIVGKTVLVSGRAWQIVGVMPREFAFLDRDLALLAPATFDAQASRGAHLLDVYARLKPGVSLASARQEMNAIGRQLEEAHPDTNRGHGANVEALQSALVRPIKTRLVVLLGAVGLVLLLACVNVASLMMVRSARREREMALRAALGAGRARLFQQHIAESMAMAVAGGVVGLLLAYALIRLLPVVLPTQLSVVQVRDLTIDGRVLAGASMLVVLTGIVCGLMPSIRASRPDLVEPLKSGGRGTATLQPAFRVAVVIGEVALATLTLVGAGLIVRSFMLITAQPLGVITDGRMTVSLVAPSARYSTPEAKLQAMQSLEERLAAIPGVSGAGAIDILPLSGDDARRSVVIEGQTQNPDAPTRMHLRVISPNYPAVAGMQVRQGRSFGSADSLTGPPVAIINEAAARRFWPGQNPVGRRWNFGRPNEPWITVVGVVNDVRHWGLSRLVNPMVYLPLSQQISNAMTFELVTDLDAATLTAAARQVVKAFDPAMPVGDVEAFSTVVARSLRSDRAQMLLMSTFGILALVLAAVGIYGVIAQLVAARVQEIGVRVALGAGHGHIVRLIVTGCLWQTVSGIAIGTLAGAWFASLASTLLFAVKPWDPLTLSMVAGTLIVASLIACLMPVLRALRVDAAVALRG